MNFKRVPVRTSWTISRTNISAAEHRTRVSRLQPLCEMGSVASAQSFHWSGLHCDRTLCKNRTACQWTVCDCKFGNSGKKTRRMHCIIWPRSSFRVLLMPVGDYTKIRFVRLQQNRSSVAKRRIPRKSASCRIRLRFLYPERDRIVAPKGNFVNTKGEILGTREGITHYTVGQRRGLGLPMGHGTPRVRTGNRPETNGLWSAKMKRFSQSSKSANKVNYMAIPPLELGEELPAPQNPVRAQRLPVRDQTDREDEITCTFPDGVRAPTPGQAVVFYVDGCVGGGGTITEAER